MVLKARRANEIHRGTARQCLRMGGFSACRAGRGHKKRRLRRSAERWEEDPAIVLKVRREGSAAGE